MTTHNHDQDNQLHLHGEPELEQLSQLLDQIAQRDRDAMPDSVNANILEAVSAVFAPEPIAIEPAILTNEASQQRSGSAWKFRFAAAALLATATTLSIVATQPWSSGSGSPSADQPSPASTWSLASFEQDLDAYLSLEDVGDDQLDDAVADWELWAQTLDADVDTGLFDSDLYIDLNDGAI